MGGGHGGGGTACGTFVTRMIPACSCYQEHLPTKAGLLPHMHARVASIVLMAAG